MTPEVTIAVVSWNTRELLRRCLISCEEEANSGRCEVWVVDNASSDGSAAMVREEFAWARLVASEQNLGFGPAVNEVASRTSAPWIVPANADVELTPGAVDSLLSAGANGRVGAVAPRLVMSDGTTQHSAHPFPSIRLAFLFALGAYRLPAVGERLMIEGYWDPDRPRSIDWAHGAFLLVRRKAYDEVGGFDAAQWMYAEDIDLQWRLSEAGWLARYEPRAWIGHAVSAAAELAFGSERTQRHLLATYAWQARRRGLAVAWVCAVLNAAGAGARWAGLATASRFDPERYGAARDRASAYVRSHLRGLRTRAALERAVAGPRA